MAAPRTLPDAICLTCKVTFRPDTAGRSYCSRKCYFDGREARDAAQRVELTCAQCGEAFVVKGKQKASAQRYCSRKCQYDAARVRGVVPERKPDRALVCEECGEAFVVSARATQARFCSDRCWQASYRRRKAEARPGRAPRVAPDRRCENCGESFQPHPGASAARFCSKACYHEHGRGERAAAFKGGRTINSQGYVRVLVDGRYRAEHRVVMERKLGRSMLPGESVHHRNGVRDDNRPENLELRIAAHPSGLTVDEAVAHAVEVLERYAPERLR